MKSENIKNNKLSPPQKAIKTGRNAKTFTKVALTKLNYKYLDFDTKKGNEYIGVVDLVAIKRHKNELGQLDDLEIILFQVKGGSKKVSDDEIERLKEAVKNVKITWNIAKKQGQKVLFDKEIKSVQFPSLL